MRKWTLSLISILLVLTTLIGCGPRATQEPPPAPTEPPTAEPTTPPTAEPEVEIAIPPTLADLADDYPQFASILTDPELDTAYKEFLIAYAEGGEEAAMELAHQRGILTPDDDAIHFFLVLDTEDNAPVVAELESAGAIIIGAYRDMIDIAVPIELIQAQLESDDPALIFEQLTQLEHVIAVRLPEQDQGYDSNIPGEGVAVTNASAWHAAGITGEGLRIGVLDLGFYGWQELQGVELPDNVTVQTFGMIDEGGYHGTGCAEIIHEMAPGAELFFAWFDGNSTTWGQAVDWLASQNVDIISNSTGSNYGPRDGSRWKSRIIDDLASRGIVWVNAAGNEADQHYRATFTDTDGNGLHEFAPGQERLGVNVRDDFRILLEWEDNWDAAAVDYQFYLYDEAGNLLGRSEDAQTGQAGQTPAEVVGGNIGQGTVYVVVQATEGSPAVTFDIFGIRLGWPTITSPEYSLSEPSDARGALAVGAVNYSNDVLEEYSSHGPSGDGRLKPEISSPTNISTASYGSERPFNGTSAACPHVSGAAALVWQANPNFTRDEVVNYLLTNAIDLGAAGPDNAFGHGRLYLPDPGGTSVEPQPTTEPTQPAPTTAPTTAPIQPSPTATPTQPSSSGTGSGLDYRLDPRFGTVDLSAGFWPDPFTVSDMTVGGTVGVSGLNLGSGCTGYASSAPDLRLNLSGSSNRIRIFFVPNNPSDDATLIVNDARADWHCNDDSAGTLSPMVEIQNPPNGQFDIWVGSYRSGEAIPGTIYITELNEDPSNYLGGGSEPQPTIAPTTAPTQPSSSSGGQLDYTMSPNFGTISLASGFWPDPQETAIRAGGTVDVWSLNLGSGCTGYASSAPDLRLQLTSDSPALRIFFVADTPGADATMIVNNRYAQWVCNDDSSGTLNPMVELRGAPAGQYDIWVGSYSSGEAIPGTIYITEMDYDPGDY